jgi:hypothetical protein
MIKTLSPTVNKEPFSTNTLLQVNDVIGLYLFTMPLILAFCAKTEVATNKKNIPVIIFFMLVILQ